MTFRWLESLLEKDVLDADWCRLPAVHPFWTMWWFRACTAVLCLGLVWILWQFV